MMTAHLAFALRVDLRTRRGACTPTRSTTRSLISVNTTQRSDRATGSCAQKMIFDPVASTCQLAVLYGSALAGSGA